MASSHCKHTLYYLAEFCCFAIGSCKSRLQEETDLSLERGLQLLQQAQIGEAQAVFKRGLATFDVWALSLAMANDEGSVGATSRAKLEQMLDICEIDLRGERGTASDARIYLSPKPDYSTPENTEPDPSYVANDLIIRAAMHFTKENFASALQDLNQADHLQPDDHATLQLRGQVKALLKDYTGAVQDLTGRALDGCPELTIRIGSYVSIGDVDRACADLVVVEEKYPEAAKHLLALLERGHDWGHPWGPAPDAATGRAVVAAMKARKRNKTKASSGTAAPSLFVAGKCSIGVTAKRAKVHIVMLSPFFCIHVRIFRPCQVS